MKRLFIYIALLLPLCATFAVGGVGTVTPIGPGFGFGTFSTATYKIKATRPAATLSISSDNIGAVGKTYFAGYSTHRAAEAVAVQSALNSKTSTTTLTNYSTHRQPEINARKVFHGIQSAGTPTWAANVFTLPTSGGNVTYWYQGNKYSSLNNITLALTPVADTLYFVSFDSANGTLSSSTTAWSLLTQIPVATVMVNAAGAVSVADERHGYTRDLNWHLWAHLSVGTRYITGGSLSGIGGSGTGVTWSISATTIMDEDITHSLAAFTQANGARKFRQTSASAIRFEDSSYPFYWSGTSAQWVDAGYALQTFASNQYINVFVYGTGDTTKPYWFFTPPIAAVYTTVANARAVAPPSLAAVTMNPEMKLLWRMVVSGGASPAIQAITTADDYRTSSTVPSGGTSVPNASNVSFAPYTSTKSTWTNVQTAITEAARQTDNHINSIVPAGGHPAAGSNGQFQYNNSGAFSGAAYVSYSASAIIQKSTTRYMKSNITKGYNNSISSYMLGHGLMVIGTPYTDAFIVSAWSPVGNEVAGFTFYQSPSISPVINHVEDLSTCVKGVNILFRNFTSFDAPYGCRLFTMRRKPAEHTKIRVVLDSSIRDQDGNYLFKRYSSPFYNYSTAGI